MDINALRNSASQTFIYDNLKIYKVDSFEWEDMEDLSPGELIPVNKNHYVEKDAEVKKKDGVLFLKLDKSIKVKPEKPEDMELDEGIYMIDFFPDNERLLKEE